MLLNCTNHPYFIWSEPMKEAAERQYGEVVDLLFPEIDLVILESWYREALRGSLNRKEELHVRNQS